MSIDDLVAVLPRPQGGLAKQRVAEDWPDGSGVTFTELAVRLGTTRRSRA